MKKVTMSVVALTMTVMSYGQTIKGDSVTFSRYEMSEMIGTLEDILEWQQEDMDEGVTSHGSYEEMWGSNYWLTELVDEMWSRYSGKNNYIQPHNR